MRRAGIFSTYTRAATCRKEDGTDIGKSLLGLFAAGEAHLLTDFVRWTNDDVKEPATQAEA